MADKAAMPTAKVIASVHSRVHYCREGAIVRLRGGRNQLVCRNNGRNEQYDLYLEENLLLDAHIANCCTLGATLKAGYGEGVMGEEARRDAAERVNSPFADLSTAVQRMAPLMGLLASGLYLVTDCELQPVLGSRFHHCLNAPHYDDDYDEVSCFTKAMYGHDFDAPLYFMPTQRASALVPERIRYYMEWMERNDYQCPRAIALYLNGAVSLLLDGHHKAAAAAALGKRLRTLVIFPLQEERNVEAAIRKGKKLELYHGRWNVLEDCPNHWGYNPLHLMDEDKTELSQVRYLQRYPVNNEILPRQEVPEWGIVPEEFCEKLKQYPSSELLSLGTYIPPDRIKAVMRRVREAPNPLPKEPYGWDGDFPWDWLNLIYLLHEFAVLFPESPMLTQEDREWLVRIQQDAKQLGLMK